jgi:hypothetical protein
VPGLQPGIDLIGPKADRGVSLPAARALILAAMQEPLDNLSQDARLVQMSLIDHPELTTPEAIAGGEYGIEQLSPGAVADALRELQAAGRAAESFGGWSILS